MRIGALNRRVSLERGIQTRSDSGAVVTTWEPIAEVWAAVRFPSGAETIRNGVQAGVTRASIRIRYRDDLDATCRVVYAGNPYDIKAVQLDEVGRQYADLVAETGENNG